MVLIYAVCLLISLSLSAILRGRFWFVFWIVTWMPVRSRQTLTFGFRCNIASVSNLGLPFLYFLVIVYFTASETCGFVLPWFEVCIISTKRGSVMRHRRHKLTLLWKPLIWLIRSCSMPGGSFKMRHEFDSKVLYFDPLWKVHPVCWCNTACIQWKPAAVSCVKWWSPCAFQIPYW